MHQPRRRGVRQVGGADQVDAPDLDRVEAERPRAEVEHALHHERRGRAGHAAVRARRCRVRRHRRHLAPVVGELVRTRQEAAGHERLDARRPRVDGVGAGIAVRAHVHGGQPPVGVEARRAPRSGGRAHGPRPRIASRRVSTHFTGRSEAHGQQAEHDVLGIDDGLDAEAAADVGGDDPHAVLGQPQHLAEAVAREVRNLRARVQRELLLGGVPLRDAAAALERRRRLAVGAKRALDHHGRRRKRRLHVAVVEAAREEHVVGRLVVHDAPRRRARQPTSTDGGQRLVVDGHEPGRVLGQRSGRRRPRRRRPRHRSAPWATRASAAPSRRSSAAPTARAAGSRRRRLVAPVTTATIPGGRRAAAVSIAAQRARARARCARTPRGASAAARRHSRTGPRHARAAHPPSGEPPPRRRSSTAPVTASRSRRSPRSPGPWSSSTAARPGAGSSR